MGKVSCHRITVLRWGINLINKICTDPAYRNSCGVWGQRRTLEVIADLCCIILTDADGPDDSECQSFGYDEMKGGDMIKAEATNILQKGE